MKLNIYSVITFSIIIIILYPLVFYFSDKKVSNKNNSETSYVYDIQGFLKLKSLEANIYETNKKIIKLNKSFFDNEKTLKFIPNSKMSLSRKNKVSFDSDNIFLFDQQRLTLYEEEQSIIKNEEIVIIAGSEIIFYFDLKNFFNYLYNYIHEEKLFDTKFSEECGNIRQRFKNMSPINYSLYQFSLSIDQKIVNKAQFSNENKILDLFEKCFSNSIIKQVPELEQYIELNINLQKDDFKISFENFIKKNKELFTSQKQIEDFEKKLNQIKNGFIQNLSKIDLQIKLIKDIDIKTEEKFIKKFNVYVVSFILSFLITLIIFYILFFLRNQFKFLRKIF